MEKYLLPQTRRPRKKINDAHPMVEESAHGDGEQPPSQTENTSQDRLSHLSMETSLKRPHDLMDQPYLSLENGPKRPLVSGKPSDLTIDLDAVEEPEINGSSSPVDLILEKVPKSTDDVNSPKYELERNIWGITMEVGKSYLDFKGDDRRIATTCVEILNNLIEWQPDMVVQQTFAILNQLETIQNAVPSAEKTDVPMEIQQQVYGPASAAKSSHLLRPAFFFWLSQLATDDLVRQGQTYIEEIIGEEGPFDRVIGFSQGAALAASIMLEHAKIDPFEDIFKLAIFAGASSPFEMSSQNALMNQPAMQREDSESSESSVGDEEDPHTSWRIPKDFWDPIGPILGRFHPERTPTARIRQPTLHLIGDRDEYAGQGQMLTKMCSGQATVIHRLEGHRIPRDKGFNGKAVRAMEHLISRVSLTCKIVSHQVLQG